MQAGIPDAIPVEMCYLGWQESLNQLAAVVSRRSRAEVGDRDSVFKKIGLAVYLCAR